LNKNIDFFNFSRFLFIAISFAIVLIISTPVFSVPLAVQNFSGAINYSITSTDITLQVDASGYGSVVERFYLSFNSGDDRTAFREKSASLGTDTVAWATFNPEFSLKIGANNQYNGRIFYSEADIPYLEISYDISDPVFVKTKESSISDEYELKANYFSNFFSSGLWIIPDNTTISFDLPPTAEVKQPISPDATTVFVGTKKLIVWDGYKSSNKISLNFVVLKKISIDLTSFSAFLFNNQIGNIVLGIIILFLAVAIIFHKKIVEMIESFVESNSKINEE
jgi:hypothetical protein